MEYIKCCRCDKQFSKKRFGRFLDLVCSLRDDYDYCPKCAMESRRELDRTGRYSKKDKYKNKDERENCY